MVILTGPTAVGKTELSIRLAKILDAEIISADSMQVYKKMDIGTAKIMPEEMEGIKHYLVDELDPKEEFHVARFQQMAKDALKEIYAKGKIPLIVGGTGFYIQSLLYDIDFTKEDGDQEYRKQLEEKAKREGNDSLYEMLKQVDPKSIEKIHKNNVKRVIRALEFYKLNGYPISEHNEKEAAKTSPYNFAYFVLNHKRDILYDRINRRVDIMAEQGLIDEVKRLKEEGYEKTMVSMQGLGHLRCEAREPGEPVGPEHEQAEREDREREPVEHVLVAAADGYETEGRSDGEHRQEGEEDRVVGLKGGEDHGGDACHERGRRQQDVRLADLMAPDVESPDGEGPDGAEVPEGVAGEPEIGVGAR